MRRVQEGCNALIFFFSPFSLALRTSISGDLPSGLGSQSQLTYLSLIGNHLTGSIPETIGMSRGLKLLDLSFNKLSGAVPASLAALSQLKVGIRTRIFRARVFVALVL